jgi:hypothetical protein
MPFSEPGGRLFVQGSIFSGSAPEDHTSTLLKAEKSATNLTPSHSDSLANSYSSAAPTVARLGEDGTVVRGVKDLHWLHEQQKVFSSQTPSAPPPCSEAISQDVSSALDLIIDVPAVMDSSKPGPPSSGAAEGRASRTGLKVLKYGAKSGH